GQGHAGAKGVRDPRVRRAELQRPYPRGAVPPKQVGGTKSSRLTDDDSVSGNLQRISEQSELLSNDFLLLHPGVAVVSKDIGGSAIEAADEIVVAGRSYDDDIAGCRHAFTEAVGRPSIRGEKLDLFDPTRAIPSKDVDRTGVVSSGVVVVLSPDHDEISRDGRTGS